MKDATDREQSPAFARMNKALEGLDDVPLSKLTVADILYIIDAGDSDSPWEEVLERYADKLERMLQSANAEKPQPTNEG